MSEITEIIAMTEIPEDAAAYCEECFAKIKANDRLFELLQLADSQYSKRWEPKKTAELLAKESGLHRYTVDLIILLYAALRLRHLYATHGYSEELFRKTVPVDIRCKVAECRQVYGIIGTFVFDWYDGFYDCSRFACGRLQFEPRRAPFGYKDIFQKGDFVLACHIPSMGPLLVEDVEQSLRQAYELYRPNGPLVVICHSWLLYPPFYREVFPENSNLRRFYELFDIVDEHECSFTTDGWRVFGTMESDLDKLPLKTTLHRNLHAYLKKGNQMGNGYGVLIRNYEQ